VSQRMLHLAQSAGASSSRGDGGTNPVSDGDVRPACRSRRVEWVVTHRPVTGRPGTGFGAVARWNRAARCPGPAVAEPSSLAAARGPCARTQPVLCAAEPPT